MPGIRIGGWLTVALLAVIAWLMIPREVRAYHTAFVYRADRFELDGNVWGAKDGVPDVVDEFNDGVLAPYWYQAMGTVSEADGMLVVSSPGVHFTGPNGEALDLSIAASASPLYMRDGGGSFTGTVYWENRVPDVGHHYHFSVYTWGSGSFFSETFGTGIRRSDTALEIEQHLTDLDGTHGVYRNTMLNYHTISAADITGQVGFRIAFDDATNRATTSFSLDGGASWRSPFPSGEIFVGRTYGQFLVSADPSTPISLTPVPCVPDGCRRSGASQKVRLKIHGGGEESEDLLDWKWRKGEATNPPEFGDPLGTTAYEVCIGDAAGNPVFRVEIPPGGYCGDRPCWKRQGRRGYKYENPGGQISQLRVAAGVEGRAKVTVKGGGAALDPPALPLGLPATVRVRNAVGTCWAAEFDTGGVIRSTSTDFLGTAAR